MGTISVVFWAALFLPIGEPVVDSTTWGQIVNGMRLGISYDQTSTDLVLRIFFQNVSPVEKEILIGNEVAPGTQLCLNFYATGPAGKELQGFELNDFSISSLYLPAVVRLDHSGTHALRVPLNRIICPERPGNLTFDDLVKQGFTVRVSLEMDSGKARWARLSSPWIGKMDSGELSPPKR